MLRIDLLNILNDPLDGMPAPLMLSVSPYAYDARAHNTASTGAHAATSRWTLSSGSIGNNQPAFESARITEYAHRTARGRDIEQWVKAFSAKVDAIAQRAPCPSSSGSRRPA